jgi:hypothetical protein
MKTIEKLNELLAYYYATRQCGHTMLMKEGTEHYDREILVLARDMSAGDNLNLNSKQIVSWSSNLDKLRGQNKPLAIDNGTMMIILRETLLEFELLEDENETLKKQRNQILKILKDN